MLRLNVPNAAYATQEVSLGGLTYTMVYRFNDQDDRWRFDLYLGDSLIVGGMKIMENTSLLRFRYTFNDFSHGDIQCMQFLKEDNPVGRDNLGIGKAYELVYFSNEELGI